MLSQQLPPGTLQAFTNNEYGDEGPKAVIRLLASHHRLFFPTTKSIRKFITCMLWPTVLLSSQPTLYTSEVEKKVTKQFGYHLGLDNLETRAITSIQDYYCLGSYEQIKNTLQMTREDVKRPWEAPYIPPELVVATYYAYCHVNNLVPIPLHYRLTPYTNEELTSLILDGTCPAEAYLYGSMTKYSFFYVKRKVDGDQVGGGGSTSAEGR